MDPVQTSLPLHLLLLLVLLVLVVGVEPGEGGEGGRVPAGGEGEHQQADTAQ